MTTRAHRGVPELQRWTAAAAELASTYAPELNIKGTFAGAPPADLLATVKKIDGTSIAGAIGYAVNGLAARYPALGPILDKEASAEGLSILTKLSTQCIADSIFTYGFKSTKAWTTSGQPLADVIARYPEALKSVEDQRIGHLKPNAPVLVDSGINDDIVPHDQVVQMVDDWKAQGADVTLINDRTISLFPGLGANHIVPYLRASAPAMTFLDQRFNATS